MNIIELLHELSQAEGSQANLAKKLNLSLRALTLLVTGRRQPTLRILRSIGGAYPGRRRDVDRLMWGE